MSDERVLLVSADSHGGLPTAAYEPYLESRYQEDFDRWMTDGPGRYTAAAQELAAGASASQPATIPEAKIQELADRHEFATNADSAARVKDLELDGIVAEVIFADINMNVPPFSSHFAGPLGARAAGVSAELQFAGHRAYNRWLAEFCSPFPGRELGVALLSLWDIDEAVKEVERAAREGLCGVLLSEGVMDGELPLYHPDFDRLWAACAHNGMVVHSHGGTGCPDYSWDDPVMAWFVYTELHWFAHRPLWWMIWGGVLERHPQLKLVFAEQGTEWVVDALARMDWQWEGGGMGRSGSDVLPLKPSEYWRRQCGVVCSLQFSAEEAKQGRDVGIEALMFGTDYPHSEGTWGHTLPYIRRTLGNADLAEIQVRAVLGANAARFYNLDLKALAPLVEMHGPTIADLMTSSEERLPEHLETAIRRPKLS